VLKTSQRQTLSLDYVNSLLQLFGFWEFDQCTFFLSPWFCFSSFFIIIFFVTSLRFTYLFFGVFSGLGQDDTEYIDITEEGFFVREVLFEAFSRAGFANQTHGKYRLLPCTLGTFVNQTVSNSNDLKCLECPAGKVFFINVTLNLKEARFFLSTASTVRHRLTLESKRTWIVRVCMGTASGCWIMNDG